MLFPIDPQQKYGKLKLIYEQLEKYYESIKPRYPRTFKNAERLDPRTDARGTKRYLISSEVHE
jgi:hypothetical protein